MQTPNAPLPLWAVTSSESYGQKIQDQADHYRAMLKGFNRVTAAPKAIVEYYKMVMGWATYAAMATPFLAAFPTVREIAGRTISFVVKTGVPRIFVGAMPLITKIAVPITVLGFVGIYLIKRRISILDRAVEECKATFRDQTHALPKDVVSEIRYMQLFGRIERRYPRALLKLDTYVPIITIPTRFFHHVIGSVCCRCLYNTKKPLYTRQSGQIFDNAAEAMKGMVLKVSRQILDAAAQRKYVVTINLSDLLDQERAGAGIRKTDEVFKRGMEVLGPMLESTSTYKVSSTLIIERGERTQYMAEFRIRPHLVPDTHLDRSSVKEGAPSLVKVRCMVGGKPVHELVWRDPIAQMASSESMEVKIRSGVSVGSARNLRVDFKSPAEAHTFAMMSYAMQRDSMKDEALEKDWNALTQSFDQIMALAQMAREYRADNVFESCLAMMVSDRHLSTDTIPIIRQLCEQRPSAATLKVLEICDWFVSVNQGETQRLSRVVSMSTRYEVYDAKGN